MPSRVKSRNSNFTRIEKSKYYLATRELKVNGSEYSFLGKIYNALFSSVLEYIHTLSMLYHGKYRNSNFM